MHAAICERQEKADDRGMWFLSADFVQTREGVKKCFPSVERRNLGIFRLGTGAKRDMKMQK